MFLFFPLRYAGADFFCCFVKINFQIPNVSFTFVSSFTKKIETMIAQNTKYASADGCANSTVFTPETEEGKSGFYLKEHDHFNGKMYFLKEIPGPLVGSGLHTLTPGVWIKTAYDYYTGMHTLLKIYKTGAMGGDLDLTEKEEAEAIDYFNALNAPKLKR